MRRGGLAVLACLTALVAGVGEAAADPVWHGGGPAAGTIGLIEIDPSDSLTVYGAGFSALYRTRDGGGTWTRAASRVGFLLNLEVDPARSQRLYAATNGELIRSDDRGETWERLPVAGANAVGVVGQPGGATVVLVSTFENGLLRSSDGGGTWVDSGAGIGLDAGSAYWFGQSPLDPQVVYTLAGPGAFRSDDAGRTWEQISLPPDTVFVSSLVPDPFDRDTLYLSDAGRLLRSLDGGATWAEIGEGLPAPGSAFLAGLRGTSGAPSILYAVYDSGIYRSRDGGEHWVLASAALTAFGILGLAVDPSDGERVILANGFGVFVSTDAATTFAPAVAGLPGAAVQAVAAGPAGAVYAGILFGPVAASADAGVGWDVQAATSGPQHVIALAVDPGDGRHAFGGTYSGGVQFTRDGGRTWAQTGRGLPRAPVWDLEVIPGGGLLAATEVGVFRAGSAQEPWVDAGAGLPNTGVRVVAFAPSDSATVYAGLDRAGVALSTDGGLTWRRAGLGRRTVLSIAVDPTRAETLYAATRRAGVFRSDDAGQTWRRLAGTALTAAVVIDPSAPGTVLLATGQRVLISRDGGSSFSSFDSGLPERGGSPLNAEDEFPRVTLGLAVAGTRVFLATWFGVFSVELG